MSLKRRLHALVRPPMVVLGAALFLFEELLWGGLGRLMGWLARLPVVARAEAVIADLPPYGAMAVFLLPVAVILPLKVVAVWLMSSGRLMAGLAVLFGAKLTGMALWARIYALCRPALVRLAWFARLEARVMGWQVWAHGLVARFAAWRQAKRWIQAMVAGGSAWLRGVVQR